jgi:hypothetical protein
MDKEKIKEAFFRIKEDINVLAQEISQVKEQLEDNALFLKSINDEISQLKLENITRNSQRVSEKVSQENPTNPTESQTYSAIPTDNPTHAQEIGGWNTSFLYTSIGNDGVPTDKQTNRQTNQQTHFKHGIPSLGATDLSKDSQMFSNVVTNNIHENFQEANPEITALTQKPIKQQISEATEILDSLDNIKKEIRRKFRSITKQEMVVFSMIYVMDEQDPEVDYKKVASRLNLSESSIRDYVQKIVNKGVPIEKEKLNNKKIILHISPELKKIATLDTIIKLRDL